MPLASSVGWALLAVSVMIAGAAFSPLACSDDGKRFRVLHVTSYHVPWIWTDDQLDGFKEGLRGLDVEYKVFQMDTKRQSSEDWKRRAGAEARRLIERWKPDLLYTNDDNAQEYVARHYVGADLPIVFSGVNADPAAYGFVGSPNVTGVLEQEHFVESVRLLKRLVPDARRVAVVLDDDPTWPGVVERMKRKLADLPDVEIVAWDTIQTFTEYKHKIAGYLEEADAIALLGVFTFKDKDGENVPYLEVLQWTAENSRLPDFSFWRSRVEAGTLCTVTVSGYEQGLAAGNMARRILLGRSKPSEIPIAPTVRGEPIISLARANALGLRIRSSLLLRSTVITDYQWQR